MNALSEVVALQFPFQSLAAWQSCNPFLAVRADFSRFAAGNRHIFRREKERSESQTVHLLVKLATESGAN